MAQASQHTTEMTNDGRVYVTARGLQSLALQARGLALRAPFKKGTLMAGRAGAKLRQRGLDFEDLREYVPGDDVRAIDWKVTARTGSTHIRTYSEESNRSIFIVVDQRQSMFFGSEVYMKSVIAAETAALLAFAATERGDRVGGLIVSPFGVSEHTIARKRDDVHRFVEAVAQMNRSLNAGGSTHQEPTMKDLLEQAARNCPPGALIALISDFNGFHLDYMPVLRRLAHKGNLLAFPVLDVTGHEALPKDWKFVATDGKLQAELDLTDGDVHAGLSSFLTERLRLLERLSDVQSAVVADMNTTETAAKQLARILGARR